MMQSIVELAHRIVILWQVKLFLPRVVTYLSNYCNESPISDNL